MWRLPARLQARWGHVQNVPDGIDLTFIDGFPNTPGAYDRDDLAMAVAAAAKATEQLRQHAQRLVRQKKTDCDKADSAARARIAGIDLRGVPNRVDVIVKELNTYFREYRAQTRVWDERNAEKRIAQRERAEKTTAASSLPTPFGGFNVIPGLALVGLAFGTFFSYVGVQLWIRRIRALALEFTTRFPGDPIAVDGPAPFWAWAPNKQLDAAFGWSRSRRRPIFAFSFHLAWVAILALLAWEARYWRAADDVLFAPNSATVAVLNSTVPIAAVLFGSLLLSGFTWPQWTTVRMRIGAPTPRILQSRRRVLAYGAAVLAAAAGMVVLRSRISTQVSPGAIQRQRPGITGADVADFIGEFVGNPRTRTLHHDRDTGHRPRQAIKGDDIAPAERDSYVVHKGGDVIMTRARKLLAEPAVSSETIDRTFTLMAKAITLQPGALHLFDHFVAVAGRLKRYDAVDQLIAKLASAREKPHFDAHWTASRRRHERAERRRAAEWEEA